MDKLNHDSMLVRVPVSTIEAVAKDSEGVAPIAAPVRDSVDRARSLPGPRPIDPRGLRIPDWMTSKLEMGALLGWSMGKGSQEDHMTHTRELIAGLTPERLAEFKARGLTTDMVAQWEDFYTREQVRVPRNPNAAARAAYLHAIHVLFGG